MEKKKKNIENNVKIWYCKLGFTERIEKLTLELYA